MPDNDLILKTLMAIQKDLGALQQDSESSQRQRAVLFEKSDRLYEALTSLDAKITEHIKEEMELKTKVEEHEKTLSPFRDIKTKGLGILAIIALTGGTLGSQAEKLFMAILGK